MPECITKQQALQHTVHRQCLLLSYAVKHSFTRNDAAQHCTAQYSKLTSRQVAIALEPRTDCIRLLLMAAAEEASAAATVNCTSTLDGQQHRLMQPATAIIIWPMSHPSCIMLQFSCLAKYELSKETGRHLCMLFRPRSDSKQAIMSQS
jgi:hypothetical protein